ncbi:MAG TPA: glycosyltransferase family 39 protein [Candidatus Acidoferrales bacterium]
MTKSQRALKIIAITVAGFVPAVAFFTQLATVGLVGPDEPRYAWIARAMAQTHDWVTPRLYGQPWFEKPVLYYWAAGIAFRFLKSGEIAARLPSAIAALLAACAIAWFALKEYGERTAWIAVMIFSTTGAAIAFSHAATPDMLFSASLACAMVCAGGILREEGLLRGLPPQASADSQLSPATTTALVGTKTSAAVLGACMGAWLGAATLAKGPAAIVLAGGSLALWAACTRNWRALRRFVDWYVVGAFAIVAVPWYVICAARNPDFLRTFFLLHNVERYFSPVFQHVQPFWFFGPILLFALIPWTILLFPAAAEGRRLWHEKSWRNSPGFFAACWAVFPVVFFSASQSKLPGYILPAIPALALLLAIGFERWIDRTKWPVRYLLAAAGVTLWLILFWVAHQFAPYIPDYFVRDIRAFEILVFFVVSTTPFLARPRVATGMLAACVLFVLTVGGIALSIKTPQLSARPLLPPRAWFVVHRDESIAVYQVNRNWEYGLNFYYGRELPEWTPEMVGVSVVFTSPDGLNDLGDKAMVGNISQFGNPPCVRALVVPEQP